MIEENIKFDVYKSIESDIVSLRLLPGEVITEKELCERFNMSRTPIRSVLQRLEENGFISIVPHKSTTVTTIKLDIVTQLIYQRIAVESMVLRDFIRNYNPTEIENVRYQARLMEELAEKILSSKDFDIQEFLERDHKMHEVWFNATDKAYLWKNITKPDPNYARLMRLDVLVANNIEDVINEHRQLMDIIDNRKFDRIEECISLHLYGGVRRLGSRLFSDEYKRYFGESRS